MEPKNETANGATQKYSDEQYLEQAPDGYFGIDEEHSHHAVKMVTTRTPHQCSGTAETERHDLPPGTRAIYESSIHVDAGRVSNYLCLPCADTWLDDVHGNEE